MLWLIVALLVLGASTFTGFAAARDTGWTHFPFGNSFNALETDGASIWIASRNGGVLQYNVSTGTWLKYSQGRHCLPSNIVEDIAVDGSGDIWIATAGGVGRRPADADFDAAWDIFDSSNSPLPDGNITAIETAPDGSIWVGTFDSGLFHRRSDGTWDTFTTANSPLSDNFVTSIAFDLAGDAWIGVWGDGVDRFDGVTWTNFDPSNTFPGGTGIPNCLQMDVNSMPPDQLGLISSFAWVIGVDPVTGDVWFDNDDDGPCLLNGTTRFDGTNWFTYTDENSNALQDHHDALLRDAHGDLLFSSNSVYERFTGNDWIPADSDGNFVPGPDMVMDGNVLWIAAASGELVRISAGTPTSFIAPGPVDSAVWGVTTITTQLLNEPPMDRDAIAWFATRSGVQRFDGVNWITFDSSNSGLPVDRSRGIAQDLDGALWIGTDQNTGVSRFDGQSWQNWDADDGLLASRIDVIEVHPATGEKWMISGTGSVWRTFDGSTFTSHPPPPAAGQRDRGSGQLPGIARDLAIAGDGSIWIPTAAGLVHVIDDTWSVMTEKDGLPIDHMFTVDVDANGHVWTGSSIGVHHYDGAAWTTFLPVPDLPSANSVHEIVVAANGDVWAALQSFGVARYDGETWTHFTVADDNLISDQVQAMDVNSEGQIWMGTFNGVMVFSGPGPVTCPTDLAGDDAETNVFDLLELLGAWGSDRPGSDLAEPNDTVDVFDLLALLAGWGPCP